MTPRLPLSGVRILDLSRGYAGPTCTRILSELGAEVIKIEDLGHVDPARSRILAGNDAAGDFWNRSAFFLYRNAGKKSLALDFTTPQATELRERLAARADVVVESFAPGEEARNSLKFESLRQLKGDLILTHLSGYGQTGPSREYTALGAGLEAAAGIASGTGYQDGDPTSSGTSLAEPYSGVLAAGAILAAIHYRRRTGKGQYIDLSEQEATIPVTGHALMDYLLNQCPPSRSGNRSPWFAPQGCYPCRGDDCWLVLTIRDDAEWQAFCDAVGYPRWATDEQFADILGRFRHHDQLDEKIASWSRQQDQIEAMHLLQGAGIMAAAVLNPKQVLLDRHLREREYFETVNQPGLGRGPVPRPLGARFSAFEMAGRRPAPRLGEHNREVLQGLLGLGDEELARLEEEGTIDNTPAATDPIETIRASLQWPLEELLAMGALAAIEPGYKQQLGIH